MNTNSLCFFIFDSFFWDPFCKLTLILFSCKFLFHFLWFFYPVQTSLDSFFPYTTLILFGFHFSKLVLIIFYPTKQWFLFNLFWWSMILSLCSPCPFLFYFIPQGTVVHLFILNVCPHILKKMFAHFLIFVHLF